MKKEQENEFVRQGIKMFGPYYLVFILYQKCNNDLKIYVKPRSVAADLG